MSAPLTLTKTRLLAGTWEGILFAPDHAADTPPRIEALVHDRALDTVTLTATGRPGEWAVAVPIPPDAIADGVQPFLIRDADSGALLNSFVVLAGEELADGMQAELALLRAELDMLKRAFRRHCVETGTA